MDRILVIACSLMGLAIALAAFPDGALAVVFALVLSLLVIRVIRTRWSVDQDFLVRLFLLALLARLGLTLLITVFDLQSFFGGDAQTYDEFGNSLMLTWFGRPPEIDPRIFTPRLSAVGWGMYYLVASIYSLFGRNILAAQLFCVVVGAATAPLAYVCSYEIFKNRRVGQWSAIFVALYPAFIVWSGQLLKDGLIIFLLVLFAVPQLLLLLLALVGILSLRSYIFYMVAVAIVGMFVIGFAQSQKTMIASFFALILLGTTFTYFGGLQSSSRDIERFTNLEQVQRSRLDLSSRAGSGFNEEIDVSTTRGAIQAIPSGLAYLLLAPFPWEMTNIRQALTLPDMILWWLCVPFILSGFMYAFRNKLRETLGIIIFVSMLSIAYAIFQGNVGTAYRQRTQIQVFLFMFAAVGITLRLEKRENRQMLRRSRRIEAAKIREQNEQRERGLGSEAFGG
jgi:hypothetical protein